MSIEEIRKKLSEFVEYEYGEKLRITLHEYANNNYSPKFSSDQYVDFLNGRDVLIKVVHPQSVNHPYYMELFSVITQHIYGDNVYQLLDKAIEIESKPI